MRLSLSVFSVLATGCLAWMLSSPSALAQQTSAPAAPPAASTKPKPKKKAVHHTTHATAPVAHPTTQTLTLENAPPDTTSSAGKAQEARQRAADQKLLQQQEVQSDKAAQINDQQVERAQKRIDAAQDQIRVQDAPGPSQTGVVPAVGAPVTPANPDPRAVQDAPGPSQTLPATQSVSPSQLPSPPSLPQN